VSLSGARPAADNETMDDPLSAGRAGMTPDPIRAGQAAMQPLGGGIPIYQPAEVVSRTADSHALLSSTDDPGTVAQFYASALAAGGWRVVSHDRRASVVSFRARLGRLGATIAIYRRFGATGIALSTYPV
jgi:hypothetical protein